MPSVLQLLRLRQVRRQQALRRPAGRLGLGCSALFSLAAALGGIALALVYTGLVRDLPSPAALPALLDPPGGSLLQPTRFYDRSGEGLLLTLENPATVGKQILPVDQLPPALVSATLARADPSFWRHPGITLEGLFQAGHPTLAQRLVSDLLLWDEPPGLRRALRERLLAVEITASYGRSRVLAWYLNSVDYGRLAFGADAAARVYFSKPAGELSLAEAALLAAVSQAPGLNPLDAPERARERQEALLGVLQQDGWISAQQAAAARSQALVFATPAPPPTTPAPAFLALAIAQLESGYDLHRLQRGGLRVITSLDGDLQIQANCTASLQLARLAQASAVPDTCPAGRFLPILLGEQVESTAVPGANVVLFDPQTGQVLALSLINPRAETAAGAESAASYPAGPFPGLGLAPLPAPHSAGTLLTPWIYFTGFTHGWSPASLVWDIPQEPGEGTGLAGSARSTEQAAYEGPLRLRMALANDRLAPAAQVLAAVGPENVVQAASQFGLALNGLLGSGSLEARLEAEQITLIQAAQAFGVFANEGVLAGAATGSGSAGRDIQPVTILQVEATDGQVVWAGPQRQRRPVTSPQLAYLVTHVLSDETARWPSLGHPNSLEVGRPAAAKLGRTTLGRDGWALGFTPRLVAGVWAGYPSGAEPAPAAAGAGTPEIAAAIWHALVQYASRDAPPDGWPAPPGVETIAVCDPSGLLPTPDCPAVVSEVFLTGSGPTLADTLFHRIALNRETGRLATLFTPPELVEERVFLAVPPAALPWARAAGLPAPPETYDVIFGPRSTSPQTELTAPEMFAAVRGRVRITGKASGEGFQAYRLQVGSGLNPRAWVQIGQDASRSVEAGELGEWDTRGLNGLYALQLLVIRQDNRIDTAVIQVTVDNQPPEVEIPYPAGGQVFAGPEANLITLQARVKDNLGLERVEFLVDGKPIAAQVQPPFAYPWETTQGAHILRVRATDRAGNTADAEIRFVVK